MKIFIFEHNLHVKNKLGFELMAKELGWELFFSYNWNPKKIEEADIFYSPGLSFNAAEFPKKLFIFGPHLGLYPEIVPTINTIISNKNAIYIQPSDWVTNIFSPIINSMPIISLPFAVDTNNFYPTFPPDLRSNVLVYFKSRKEEDLQVVTSFLQSKSITWKEFSYKKKYSPQDYLNSLRQAKYVIWVDAHESQGFALEEALACDVPLLVWNINKMSDEVGGRNIDKFATTIPYWNDKCGEVFYKAEELPDAWASLQKGLEENKYSPRKFILDTVSPKACAKRLGDIILKYKPS